MADTKKDKRRLVEMAIPMMGTGLADQVAEIEWEDWLPMPPENTQIMMCGSLPITGFIAKDKNTNKGYSLNYNPETDEYQWDTM
jgi:hypothetical protein